MKEPRTSVRRLAPAPVFLAMVLVAACGTAAATQSERDLFFDDFEAGLARWEVSNAEAMTIIDSGDPDHGHVFRLAPAEAQISALIRGSESWPAYRIEGKMLFPTDEHNYLGVIYNHTETERRVDLGSIYIKGNGSYIRVNPRRDWNPARMLYEEYRTALTGDDAVVVGQWQRFAAEVVGNICHLYVGDMAVPKVTFDYYERNSGKAGFKPRVVGGPVWIDDIRVVAIDSLGYTGVRQPEGIDYGAAELVTDWRVLGPLTRAYPEVERVAAPGAEMIIDDGLERRWQPFAADPRGAVVTGQVVEYLGSRTVAYFATTITVGAGEAVELQFSSMDDLAIWSNGVFEAYVDRDTFGWYDFGRNPEHPPSARLPLEQGVNHVLVRVRGGIYATGGFFSRVVLSDPGTFPEASADPLSGGIPFDSGRWIFDASEHRVEEHLGRRSLRLQGGVALLEDADFTDGIIEFDLAFSAERGFPGLVWRRRDAGDYEEFYLRPHQSGNPDANQYTPVFNGVTGWQLYHGPGFGVPLSYRFEEWMHVKLVVSGNHAEAYLDSDEPVLRMLLKGDVAAGGIGLHVPDYAPAWVSGFRYERAKAPLLRATPAPLAPAPVGTVMSWSVSSPFDEAEIEGRARLSPADFEKLTWSPLAAESTGITNLARLQGLAEGANTVFARVKLRSSGEQTVRAEFGYSDRAKVYLNGQLIYAGNNGYTSRDYRYLGTIGLFDEVWLPLRQGDNELWFAVSEDFGGWGVLCRLHYAGGVEIID